MAGNDMEMVKTIPELKIKHFEGPLDLLFHLIEKNDIDIYDIPISSITEQYLAFLEDMKESFKHKFAKKPEVIEGNMKALELALKEVKKI